MITKPNVILSFVEREDVSNKNSAACNPIPIRYKTAANIVTAPSSGLRPANDNHFTKLPAGCTGIQKAEFLIQPRLINMPAAKTNMAVISIHKQLLTLTA